MGDWLYYMSVPASFEIVPKRAALRAPVCMRVLSFCNKLQQLEAVFACTTS